MQAPEHVTFRPGNLAERIARSPLAPGATAKRDLGRYYDLLDLVLEEWEDIYQVTTQEWGVIKAFVATRYWEVIPEPKEFYEQFESFLRSPMSKGFDHQLKVSAATALKQADRTEVRAIIWEAESTPPPDAATAGATSAGADAAPP